MSTRSTSSNLFSPLRDPESLIRRRNLGEPSSLFDFEEVMSIPHNNQGPPPAGPPPPNNNGPPPVTTCLALRSQSRHRSRQITCRDQSTRTSWAPSDDGGSRVRISLMLLLDSPIALSPGYVADSDPEEDSEDGPVDYPADGGDGDDDDSSNDDDEEEEASEEEEHLARPDLLLAPVSPNHMQCSPSFRAAMGRLRASLPSTYHPQHPSPPLPPPPSSLHLPPHIPTSLLLPSSPLPPLASLFIPLPVDREEFDCMCAPRPVGGHGIDYRFIGTLDAETRRQRAEEVDYRIRDVWVDLRETVEEVAPTTLEGVNDRVTELAAVQEQDTQDIYAVIEDTQDRQTQIFQSVEALIDDRQYHYETAQLLDQEALVSREAWAHSMGLSSAVHYELQGYMTHAWMPRITNNMPPRRSSATARAAPATAAAAAPMTAAAIEQLIEARVSAALSNRETLRNSTNGQGDGSHNSDTGIRGTVCTPCECTYKDFLNCKPLYFKGTEGVVVLSQWFKKMESVFHISNYAVENQVKFATWTFLRNALTWWNSYMKTITQDVAYAMDWKALKKMMTVKYCPRGGIKKLEIKPWNLKVKGTDVASHTLRLQ
ncbi:hypothetical protein Tco_0911434, partial [Tanacetum coccineum]